MHKTGLEDRMVTRGRKKLRYGYTTGTCAAAAAKAAALMLLTGRRVSRVELTVPEGTRLSLEVLDIAMPGETGSCPAVNAPSGVSCAVKKDAGDDPDVTDGLLIYACVSRRHEPGIQVDGGIGVGRITRPGMSIKPGEAAINPVPREMIRRAVLEVMEEADAAGGLEVIICVPEGEKTAHRTFNPRLGIEGGISILGTSGLVKPMSSQALIDSIRLELSMKKSAGYRKLLVTPGNYGAAFAEQSLGADPACCLACSNFVGECVDGALELGFTGLLFTAHIGKFIKVAGGIMNTHSREADCRRELMAGFALRAGADRETALKLLDCATTDEGMLILERAGLKEPFAGLVLQAVRESLQRRCEGMMETEAILFYGRDVFLGQTPGAAALLAELSALNI